MSSVSGATSDLCWLVLFLSNQAPSSAKRNLQWFPWRLFSSLTMTMGPLQLTMAILWLGQGITWSSFSFVRFSQMFPAIIGDLKSSRLSLERSWMQQSPTARIDHCVGLSAETMDECTPQIMPMCFTAGSFHALIPFQQNCLQWTKTTLKCQCLLFSGRNEPWSRLHCQVPAYLQSGKAPARPRPRLPTVEWTWNWVFSSFLHCDRWGSTPNLVWSAEKVKVGVVMYLLSTRPLP